MSRLNTYLQMGKSFNAHFRAYSNDNSIIIEANTSEGRINRSILKDDPDLVTKVDALYTQSINYQRSLLDDIVQNGLAEFDAASGEVKTEIDNFIANL